jgi:hypothetical protein
MSAQLIREYYACLNERRIADVASLLAADAVLDMPPFVQGVSGANAYAQFADAWLRAFPDARFAILQIEQRGDTICEVDLQATGTHMGALDLGGFGVLKPSGASLTLQLRELLEVRSGKIAYANLRFDINHLIHQLNRVDHAKLKDILAGIRRLTDELEQAGGDPERERDVIQRLGRAVDTARQVIRPQFNR